MIRFDHSAAEWMQVEEDGRLPHFVRHRVLSASPTEPASGLVPSGDARLARWR